MEPTAAEIEAILTAGAFGGVSFGDALKAAVASARVWTGEEVAALATATAGAPPIVEVVDESTRSAVARLGDGVGVLVSAHGPSPGGGFAKGEGGQEEDLCRSSGWLACARAVPSFHEAHRKAEPLLNSSVIASFVRVPFFARDDGPLPAPVHATMVASAAPDARAMTMSGRADADLRPVVDERVRGQLAVFRALGARTLVLAAYGCGAYGNDPRDVASAYKDALLGSTFGGAFDRVVFAISSKPRNGIPALSAFHRIFPQK